MALGSSTLEEVAEDRMLAKLPAITDNASHPLHKNSGQAQEPPQQQTHSTPLPKGTAQEACPSTGPGFTPQTDFIFPNMFVSKCQTFQQTHFPFWEKTISLQRRGE